jgi:diguanylate cyclase (GGDEF)-like protein
MELKESLEHLSDAVTQLYETVRTDTKTPLKSLFALNEIIQNADIPNVVVFADINSFKNINTKYGYLNGDLAIEKIGEVIKEQFVDKLGIQAFHISGDEFLLLFTSDILMDFKNKCDNFKSCEVLFTEEDKSKSFKVGVSFGIAINDENSDFQEIKSRAEVACKKAKTLGNGKFFEWNSDMEQNKLKEVRGGCFDCNVTIDMSFPLLNKSKINLSCPFCQKKITIK